MHDEERCGRRRVRAAAIDQLAASLIDQAELILLVPVARVWRADESALTQLDPAVQPRRAQYLDPVSPDPLLHDCVIEMNPSQLLTSVAAWRRRSTVRSFPIATST